MVVEDVETILKDVNHSSFFVCLFIRRITQKLLHRFLEKRWKVAHGPRKKPLDFDDNLDHVRVRIRVIAGFGVTVRWGRDIPVTLGVLPVICLTVTGSAAFAEVCALQNAILVMSSPL